MSVEPTTVTLDRTWLARRLGKVEARDLADVMGRLIRSGSVPHGARLPTVRALAEALEMSAGSVASAWSQLRSEGLVSTHRRGGTVVLEAAMATAATTWAGNWVSVDLAQGLADPALQPPLEEALLRGLNTPNLHSPYREPITDALRDAVMPTWPFVPEALTAAGGGSEGTLLAIEAVAPPGSTVAIEEPTSPRILDVLESIGLTVVPVACDEEGPRADALEQALRRKPVAFIYQPRAQVPLGHAVSPGRLLEISDVLSAKGPCKPWVVEDDNTGPIAGTEVPSLGAHLPDRVIHVRAYCKTFGVELRTSVIGGARPLIERISQLRSRGFGLNSRILQDAVAWLITDPQTQLSVANARRRYASRRKLLAEALGERGHPVEDRDGLMLWLPVPNENSALVNLANYGLSVGSGKRCFVTPPAGGYLRVATSRLPDNRSAIDQLADFITRAVQGKRREEFD